jgi:hypothetical protein
MFAGSQGSKLCTALYILHRHPVAVGGFIWECWMMCVDLTMFLGPSHCTDFYSLLCYAMAVTKRLECQIGVQWAAAWDSF